MSTRPETPGTGDAVGRQPAARRHGFTLRVAIVTAVTLVAGCLSSVLTGVASAAEATRPEGFGAKTTGGGNSATYWVTNLRDEGPGSLRAGAEQTTAKVIKFRVSGKIHLSRHLLVGRNKTIDGSGQRVTIKNRGFVLREPNVIVKHLIFADIGDLTKLEDDEDAILIFGARNVWIDHNTFMRAGDKLIGVPAGTDITVSWNLFMDQRQVFQIGTVSTAEQSEDTRVTVHHNYFDANQDRHPQASYGMLHAYNNYVRDWGVKGMSALRGAQLASHGNVFAAGENKKAIIFDTGIPDNKDPHPGFVRSQGDLLLNDATVKQNRPETVFDPARYYRVKVEPATQALANRVRDGAGR